jgi:hypothetical protein
MRRAVLALIALLALAGCGSRATDQQQVRDVGVHLAKAIMSDHPEDGAKYIEPSGRSQFIRAVVMAKSVGIRIKSEVPADTLSRVEHGRLEVAPPSNDQRSGYPQLAFINPGTDYQLSFTKVGGRWFVMMVSALTGDQDGRLG